MKYRVLLAVALSSTGAVASAQCPQFLDGLAQSGLPGDVVAMRTLDLGQGPQLFVSGAFTGLVSRVQRWDGQGFASVGTSGPNGSPLALGALGGDLYVTGDFTYAGTAGQVFRIARFDGSAWSGLGSGLGSGLDSTGRALETFDDGSGLALWVAGSFTLAGGLAAEGIASWDGSSWSVPSASYGWLRIDALAVYDGGGGAELYAAGRTLTGRAIASWNGASWTTIGQFGAGGTTVFTLDVLDEGGGEQLYAGGDFATIDAISLPKIARWDGSSWSSPGAPSLAAVTDLRVWDGGTGPALYASGTGGFVQRWNGAAWIALGTASGDATFLEEIAGELWTAGSVVAVGSKVVNHLARYDGNAWNATNPGGGFYAQDQRGYALAYGDLGSGSALYLGGMFTSIGDAYASSVARRDGESWSPLGSGVGGIVEELEIFDDGSGPALFAGGYFAQAGGVAASNVARWNGSAWSAAGAGFNDGVWDFEVFDDGSGAALYAAGGFSLTGAATAKRVARWTPAGWVGVGNFTGPYVKQLVIHDFGSGPRLFAVGPSIAYWNGVQWTTLVANINGGLAWCAESFDDGSGSQLYVAGFFEYFNGVQRNGIVRWNGSSWSGVGGGFLEFSGDGVAFDLATFDDGTGPALYAAGRFTQAGAVNALSFARWNGSSWSALGGGIGASTSYPGNVEALLVAPTAVAPQALWITGAFGVADGVLSANVATYADACACDPTSYCTSGTTSSGCVPSITGVGRASASAATSFSIALTGLEGAKSGHIFYGLNGPHAAPWGASSHFLCVKAPSQRTDTQTTGGSAGQCDGAFALDWNAYVATHPNSLGVPFSAGTDVWAQGFFRDPPGAKTTALSNGLRFTICP